MKRVYICSPWRAESIQQLYRNAEYARLLTRQAIEAGLAPITPHLYMSQCLNEDKPQEREAGIAAGMELLKACDMVIVGTRFGITGGMKKEILDAERFGIEVIEADRNWNRYNAVILTAMPKNCRECEYFGLNCRITGEPCRRYDQDGRPASCPIVPMSNLRII